MNKRGGGEGGMPEPAKRAAATIPATRPTATGRCVAWHTQKNAQSPPIGSCSFRIVGRKQHLQPRAPKQDNVAAYAAVTKVNIVIPPMEGYRHSSEGHLGNIE